MKERRNAVIEKLESRLEKWSAKIAGLEAEAEKTSAHARERARERIRVLREQHAVAMKHVQELRHAGEDVWHEVKSAAEKAWEELRDAVRTGLRSITSEDGASALGHRLESWMTRSVASCRPEDSLEAAARIMWEHDCGCVPVTDGDSRLVGMLTDRDVSMAAYFHGRPIGELRVADTMSREVQACRGDEDLASALAVMRRHQIRRVPVVDGEGHLRGIVALADVVREMERSRAAKKRRPVNGETLVATLAAVSERRAIPSQAASGWTSSSAATS